MVRIPGSSIGGIPAEIGSLINIESLNLFNNQLTGEIPAEIGSLVNLQTLNLYENELMNEIPTEIENLIKLQIFQCQSNYLYITDLPEPITSHPYFSDWILAPQKNYASTDYSQDGEVLTLQRATIGNGINIVVMGDAFIDKSMATDGRYEQRMNEAMEHFFSEEPYTTFRDRYNVYCVKAVSKNEIYNFNTQTIFECLFGEGTYIEGNNDKVFEYALKVSDITSLQDLTVLVILNSPKYAGICYMYPENNSSISYCPIVGYDDEQYRQIITHEAGGHGFPKLADEYAYSGGITDAGIESYEYVKTLGWQANVDIINDPINIRWAHLLADDRYAGLVNIYEGALTFEFGAYRSTETSIMLSNVGEFNAPSREAIYKSIMTLSGEGFNYEKFVEYDAINRTASATARRRLQAQKVNMKTFIPLSPPVIIYSEPISRD